MTVASALSAFLTITAATTSSAAAVDYMAQIKPLLQMHCVKCHGATTQKGKLRLDTAVSARQGGGRGAVIQPGNAETSLMIQAVSGTHGDLPQMPYKRGPLDSAQIVLLKQWIAEGAQAPNNESPSDDRHWAYVAPHRPVPPSLLGTSSAPLHPIDAFVQARLAKAGLKPSPAASPETLIRRIHLDLSGLPPTPAEADAFVAAYAKDPTGTIRNLAAKLLQSPHYGERWGRWWLDQARYADSNGYSIDAPRSIWPYRDWVVTALNADMPFDQFTIEQLAGDLLPNPSKEQLIATGFHRNTQINQEGGIDKEQFRIESVFDRVATTGTVWLGLTIGCAQCHDHKFDALSQKEYYQLFAFFNNQDEPSIPVPDKLIDPAKLQAEQKELQASIRRHIQQNQKAFSEWEAELSPATTMQLSKEAQKALKTPREKRSFAELRALFTAGPGAPDQVYRAFNERLTEVDRMISVGTTTLVMKELAKPRTTTVFIKGDFTRPADTVEPGVPAILNKLSPSPAESHPTRLDLARWLVSRENPLTARVIMNRVWQQYFGRGLVETENDFGTMGTQPTHPELLDWLAIEFMESGWSLKHMHRLIVTSAAYQQSSNAKSPQAAKLDPNNYLLWRQNRLRLDAEIVRDVCLSASGLLFPKIGGPPVYPPIPEGVMSLGQVKRAWPLSKGADRYRRGLYTFVFRATPPPGLSVFDAPEGFSSCTRRLRSNTPLQALTLLNDSAFVECAEALKKIVQGEGIDTAFQRCTSRRPTDYERKILEPLQPNEAARVLLNLDETITRE